VPGLASRAVALFGAFSFFRIKEMFAVIRTGGKQYKVSTGDVLDIERLPGDEGSMITFGEVLMAGSKVGAPTLQGASVMAEIVAQTRTAKVVAFKKKRRKNTHRKRGHRQHLTRVKITDIVAG
jgi:large subunit ribosomal protein L21